MTATGMTPLRQRMIDDMQTRNLPPATQKNYIHYVYELAKFFHRSPDELEPNDIKKFQMYLLHERKLSVPSVNQYISAVKFLYNHNTGKELGPTVWPPRCSSMVHPCQRSATCCAIVIQIRLESTPKWTWCRFVPLCFLGQEAPDEAFKTSD